jgi:hypothetical protein
MGLVNDMIRSSTTSCGIGQFKFDDQDHASKYLLQQINRNQRARWKKKNIVPKQVLMVLWSWGIKLEKEPPQNGIKLKRFLESLEQLWNPYPNSKTQHAAFTLYEDTVRSELMSIGKGRMNSKRPPIKLPL